MVFFQPLPLPLLTTPQNPAVPRILIRRVVPKCQRRVRKHPVKIRQILLRENPIVVHPAIAVPGAPPRARAQ